MSLKTELKASSSGHALLSPSSSSCWLNCVAAPFMCKGIPRKSSEYASEGTLAHALAANCLENDRFAIDFIGLPFVWDDGPKERTSIIDSEMAAYVDTYVANARAAGEGKTMFVEVRLSLEGITGEAGAAGTADIVILDADENAIEIRDLKYGMGVPVSAYENTQLMIYALAAIDQYSWFADFAKIRLVIDQVRIAEPSVWTCSREEIEKFRIFVKLRAANALRIYENGLPKDAWACEGIFAPGKKTCRWCGKSGVCRAQTDFLQQSIADDFTDFEVTEEVVTREVADMAQYSIEDLGKAAENIPFIKDYILAVEKQLNTRLHNGIKVPGWKLVLGRAGNSKWISENAVMKTLVHAGVNFFDMFELAPISPTTAKKRWGKRNARIWARLEGLVTRSEGKPNAVPESDPRPAWVPAGAEEDFEITEDD